MKQCILAYNPHTEKWGVSVHAGRIMRGAFHETATISQDFTEYQDALSFLLQRLKNRE